MKIRAYGDSDVGIRRDHNEDSFFFDEDLGVFLVADGVGGHSAGEVASQMLAYEVSQQAGNLGEMLERYTGNPNERSRQEVLGYLPRIIEHANEVIYNEAQRDPRKRGMATTAVLFLPAGEDSFICHVGDSRLYLFRDDQLFQVTEDHSLVMQLYKRGFIAAEELATHPQKNIILRSVGARPTVEVETLYLDILPGDVFLLCSDGLSDMVSDEEIADLMADYQGPDLVEQAIIAANRNGGRDNITVVVVEVHDDDDQELTRRIAPRIGMMEKVEFLQDIFLFANLTDQECVKVNRILYERDYDTAANIIRQGDEGEELFIVARGSVAVWKGDTHLTNIGPGGHFGELGILGNEKRSATVVAAEPCTLFVIRRDDFLDLLQADQTLGNKILWAFLENLADRVRDLSGRLSRR